GFAVWCTRDAYVRWRDDGWFSGSLGEALFFWILAVAGALIPFWVGGPAGATKATRALLREPRNDDGPRTALVGDDGFILKTAGGQQRRTWEAGIDSIAETNEHIFVYFTEYAPNPIPKRAFANAAAASAFVAEARRRLQAAGGPACARSLREFVAAHDAP